MCRIGFSIFTCHVWLSEGNPELIEEGHRLLSEKIAILRYFEGIPPINSQGLPLSVDEWVALRGSEALWQTERYSLDIFGSICFVPFPSISYLHINHHHPIRQPFTKLYPAMARRDVAVCKLQEHRPAERKVRQISADQSGSRWFSTRILGKV